jgi:hypothetical protein
MMIIGNGMAISNIYCLKAFIRDIYFLLRWVQWESYFTLRIEKVKRSNATLHIKGLMETVRVIVVLKVNKEENCLLEKLN